MRYGFIVFVMSMVLAGCNNKTVVEESSGSDSNFLQVHTTHELMTVIIDPQADLFWEASAIVIDESGMHHLMPVTDEGWLRTQSAAATIAEMGNTLRTPLYATGRGSDWIEFSSALTKVGKQAEDIVLGRDQKELLQVGEVLYNVCLACHEAYITLPASE